MINPSKDSATSQNRTEKEKKSVSWGGKEVVVFTSNCSLPEDCSEKASHCYAELMSGMESLNAALSGRDNALYRRKAIKAFNEVTKEIDEKENHDPVLRNIMQVAHILLARAYAGLVSSAFIHEMKLIENDPEMSERYKEWPQLLKTKSIF